MKRLVSMVVVLMIVVSTLLPTFADVKSVELKDVPKNHSAYNFIQKAIQYGLMDAKNGNFEPNKEITRIEFMKAVAKMYMPDGVTYTDPESLAIKKQLPDYDIVRYMTDSHLYIPEESIRRQKMIHDYQEPGNELNAEIVAERVKYYNSPIRKIEVAYIIASLASSYQEVMNHGSRFCLDYFFRQNLDPHIEPLTKRTKLPAFTSENVESKPIYWNNELMYDEKGEKQKFEERYDSYYDYIRYLENFYSLSIAKYMYDQKFFVDPDNGHKFDYGKFEPRSKITRASAARVLSMVYEKTKPKSPEMSIEDMHARIIVKDDGANKTIYVYGNVGTIEKAYKDHENVKIVRVNSFKDQQNIKGGGSIVLSYVPYTPGYVLNGKKYTQAEQDSYVKLLNNTVFTSLTKIDYDSFYYTSPKLTFHYLLGVPYGCNGGASGYFQAVYGIYAPARTDIVERYKGTYPEGTIISAGGGQINHIVAISDKKNNMIFEGSVTRGFGMQQNKTKYNLNNLANEQKRYNSIITVTFFDKDAPDMKHDYMSSLTDALMREAMLFARNGIGWLETVSEEMFKKITNDKNIIKFYKNVFGF